MSVPHVINNNVQENYLSIRKTKLVFKHGFDLLKPIFSTYSKTYQKIDEGGFNFFLELDKKEWFLLNDKNKEKTADFW